jgi:hypothetical protein
MTCDVRPLTRCPRCLAPVLEYCFHRAGVTGPRTTRTECQRCDYVTEHVEGAATP